MSKKKTLSSAIVRKKRWWKYKILKGSYDHYLCYLPSPIGYIASFLLKRFYSGIDLRKGQIRNITDIPDNAIIVYTGKYKSYFEFLFYHTHYQAIKIASPVIGIDYKVIIWQPVSRILRIILAHADYFLRNFSFPSPYKNKYIKNELLKGRSALVSLIDRRTFYRFFVKKHTDPLCHLIELQNSADRPVFIIPQLFLFSTNPPKSIPSLVDIFFGTAEKPGVLRRFFTLFNNPNTIVVEIAEPCNLQTFLDDPQNSAQSIEQQAVLLRRFLLNRLNRLRQSITGPVIKSPQELKQSILTGDRLRKIMEHYSERNDAPIYKVHKEADAYLDEIAAQYNPRIVKFLYMTVRWIIKLMFEGIVINNDVLRQAKNMSQQGPLIFAPCHKSHIDYLVLDYILYNNNMPCPHVAAGANLSIWPLGALFRGAGAFFIRRTFKGSAMYPKVFSEYIYTLLQEGFNLEFFIEGGRSRTGKLIAPKFGLLSILLNAYKNGACDDLIIVPVFIGYDRVPEENAYLHEIGGGKKKPESFLQVIKARKLLKKRYGKIYVNFHEPFSLKAYLNQYKVPFEKMRTRGRYELCRNLSYRILNAIDRVSFVTPHALVASVLLNSPKKSITHQYLKAQLEFYLNYLISQRAELADTLLLDPDYAISQALDSYIQRKLIIRVTDKYSYPPDEDTVSGVYYTVIDNKRPILELYKNNCIVFFIPAAFTSLVILKKDAFQFSASDLHSDYAFLQEFFKYEFAYNVKSTPEYSVRKNVKAFIDDAILIPHPTLPDTYNITAAGYRKLRFLAAFVKTYFESYRIALNYYLHLAQNGKKSKDHIKKIASIGHSMYKNKEIERSEALSEITYKNAVKYFHYHKIETKKHNDKLQYYNEAIYNHLKFL
ncbi:1-acyl-sn-glycerol-3-phosphate acyltransferase [Desulfococcaceae bacterium HSG9]|nr:1-acyl-sn-glycerol-3-phosphate acyltransferase [Desulfococcaceae bacterium HSG9]